MFFFKKKSKKSDINISFVPIEKKCVRQSWSLPEKLGRWKKEKQKKGIAS